MKKPFFFGIFLCGIEVAGARITRAPTQGVCLMFKLDAKNVLLKPSHRRQLMAWLKRSLRLGQKLGGFILTITIERVGRVYDVHATVHDTAGDFGCHLRKRDLRDACREIAKTLSHRLHEQCIQRTALA